MRYFYLAIFALVGLLAGCDANKNVNVTANSYCSLDSPPASAEVIVSKKFEPWGWAYNKADGSIPKDVTLELVSSDKTVVATVSAVRASRADVAKAFSKPELEMAGFGGSMDISAVKPGIYSINVIQQDGPRRYVCASPVKFKIVAPKA